jgi:hypothetical protein
LAYGRVAETVYDFKTLVEEGMGRILVPISSARMLKEKWA